MKEEMQKSIPTQPSRLSGDFPSKLNTTNKSQNLNLFHLFT